MNHKTKIGIGIAAGVLVLSGSAIGIASAVGGDEVNDATADQARVAAVQAVPGGKAGAVEAETNEGAAAYGVTVTKPDGSTVEVHLDKDFHVLGTQAPGQDRDEDNG